MDRVAPVTDAEVALSMTFPFNVNVVVGLGDGEGVVVPLVSLQAHVQANATSRTT